MIIILNYKKKKEYKLKDKPTIPQKSPYPFQVVEGKTYFWCQCGKSKKQPFCDGSHKNTRFKPIAYKAIETKKLFFCGCKLTSNQPFCDGSHLNK